MKLASLSFAALLSGVALVGACTVEEASPNDDDGGGCVTNADCGGDTPVCDGVCTTLPAGHPIGWGDGSAESVAFVHVYAPDAPREATDLAFHPTRTNELWIQHREYESEEPCGNNAATFAGCNALEGSVAIVTDPGLETVQVRRVVDPNGLHFMRRPPALAMGANDTFATCGEHRTGNATDDPVNFMGPTLWSSHPDVFGIQPPGKNGSHLDMLHVTPLCMGIAHERDNVYWVFNGDSGAIDRYDFKQDHGPGNDDHSDGEVARYATGQLQRVPNVPSHLKYNPDDGFLYIADTAKGQIVKLDTTAGTAQGAISPVFEPLASNQMMVGADLQLVVPAGTVTAPSGLWLHDGLIYVTDNATSMIHAFGFDGVLVRSLQTTLPPGSLAGLTVGPDGRVYFVDKPNGNVFRIDPDAVL